MFNACTLQQQRRKARSGITLLRRCIASLHNALPAFPPLRASWFRRQPAWHHHNLAWRSSFNGYDLVDIGGVNVPVAINMVDGWGVGGICRRHPLGSVIVIDAAIIRPIICGSLVIVYRGRMLAAAGVICRRQAGPTMAASIWWADVERKMKKWRKQKRSNRSKISWWHISRLIWYAAWA